MSYSRDLPSVDLLVSTRFFTSRSLTRTTGKTARNGGKLRLRSTFVISPSLTMSAMSRTMFAH